MAKHLPGALVVSPVQLPTCGEGRGKSLRDEPLHRHHLPFGSERLENPFFWGVRVNICCPQAPPPGGGGALPPLTSGPSGASDRRNMAEGGL